MNVTKLAILEGRFVYWAGGQELELRPCFAIWGSFEFGFLETHFLRSQWCHHKKNMGFRSSRPISATDQLVTCSWPEPQFAHLDVAVACPFLSEKM